MAPEKHAVMLELLKEAWVYVHLDPRRDGVLLPDFLRVEPRVVLQYGYNMPVPIHDLVIDERGIGATLSFRRVPYATFIPWTAVFAMTDGEQHGLVWQEDIPQDLKIAAEPPAHSSAPAPAPAPAPGPAPVKTPPSLSAVAPATAQKPAASPGPGLGKKPRPSHLKLVD